MPCLPATLATITASALTVAVAVVAECIGASPPPARPPNVVVIMADDVGVEAFGSYGGTSYATPRLDALAETGVRFTNCHAQPLCTPSRVKIMTGLSNVRNYVRFGVLDPDVRTFAHMLKARGYTTAVAGKWQLWGSDPSGPARGTGATPAQAGFDEHCLWQVQDRGSRYWKPVIDRNDVRLEPRDDDYGPAVFVDFIDDFMTRHRDEPFLVYYPMALVHSPYVPTPDSADRASKDKQANFGDMVAYMDTLVGRLIDRLDALGLRERTLVIFTSDNGTGRTIRTQTIDGEVRGGKSLTRDTGTHVPLIVSWPGTARASVCEDLIDLSDVLPTLADATGASRPGGVAPDGRSFLPQVRGETGTPRAWIYCYYNPRPGVKRFPERRFARDTRWKLYADGRLFDLSRDPAEKTPIAGDATAAAAAAARAKLRSAIDSFPATGAAITQPVPDG